MRDVYHGDGDRENERSERLSQAMRHDLSVMDRREHCPDEARRAQPGQQRTHPRHERDVEDDKGEDGDQPSQPLPHRERHSRTLSQRTNLNVASHE